MSGENTYHSFNAADIEKYHKGLLSAKEMHAMEKAAMDDPFLADALEGYGAMSVPVSEDLASLRKKLEERVSSSKTRSIVAPRGSAGWWKAAAAIALIAGLGYGIYTVTVKNKPNEVAKLEEKQNSKPQPVATDTSKTITTYLKNDSDASYRDGSVATLESRKKSIPLSDKAVIPENRQVSFNAENNVQNGRKDSTTPMGFSQPESKPMNDLSRVRTEEKPMAKTDDVSVVSNGYAKQNANNSQPALNYFRGQVVDNNNNPVPFANVTNVRDNIGTYADARGNFTLVSPDSMLNVQVRANAYFNNQSELKNTVPLNRINLQQDSGGLAETVVSRRTMSQKRSREANMKFEEPEPADGWMNYDAYILNNINVPYDQKMKNSPGEVDVSFEVDQNGEPVNLKVERSLCSACDQEALRLVKEGPRWKKKGKKGKRVTVTVPFK
jgi:TonB family protein